MATSLVLLGKSGFWATDTSLRIWLALMVDEIGRERERPLWLDNIAKEWQKQAASPLLGGVDPALDDVITDTTLGELDRVCQRALERLGNEIRDGNRRIALKDLGMESPGVGHEVSCPSEVVRSVGEAVLALLRNQLKTGLHEIPFIPSRDNPAWKE